MDWLLSGASREELALVAFIAGLVLLAPRVPRWGGAIGAWLSPAPQPPAPAPRREPRQGGSTGGAGE